VLESTAPEGKVQVSAACKEAAFIQMRAEGLDMDYIRFDQRMDESLLTSKGDVHDYSEVGGRTFVVKGQFAIRGHMRPQISK